MRRAVQDISALRIEDRNDAVSLPVHRSVEAGRQVMFFPADRLGVSEFAVDHAVVIGVSLSKDTSRPVSGGLTFPLSADGARAIAAQLVAAAEKLEARAAREAATALSKAAGK